MGGVVNIAVRLKSGATLCQERATNNMPQWLNVPAVFEGDEQHIRDYLSMVNGNDFDQGELGGPQPIEESEYGLVVIDLQSMTILDCNAYADIGFFDSIFTGGDQRRPAFVEFAQAGMIAMATFSREARTGDVPLVQIARTRTLSPADALRLGEERHETDRAHIFQEPSSDWARFFVEHPRMKVLRFKPGAANGASKGGQLHPAMRAKLVELEIPLTFDQGVERYHDAFYLDDALEARASIALCRVWDSQDTAKADRYQEQAWRFARRAGMLGKSDSPFFVDEPDLQIWALQGKEEAEQNQGRIKKKQAA